MSAITRDEALQFQTTDSAYYKNERTDELDRVLGDIKGMIADRESSIVRELADRVIAVADVCVLRCSRAAEGTAGATRLCSFLVPGPTKTRCQVL